MTINGSSDPTESNMLAVADEAGLSRQRVMEITKEIKDILRL